MEKNLVVMQLHLELKTHPDILPELKKYGKAEKGITRDVLIPADMTLHALHYVIQAAFGWQNSHLHNFQFPQGVFKEITGETVQGWEKYVGLYFNSPDSENMDRYWDDDYEDGKSFKNWMRKKMTGPYRYCGISEYLLEEKTEARLLINDYRNRCKKDPDLGNLYDYTEQNPRELLERLPAAEVLFPTGGRMDKRKLSQIQKKAEKVYAEYADVYFDLQKEIEEVEDQLAGGTYSKSNRELEAWALRTERDIDHILNRTDQEMLPVTSTLEYNYDYGDDWNVIIQCTDAFYCVDDISEGDSAEEEKGLKLRLFNKADEEIGGKLETQINKVLSEWRPLCIQADGLSVMDDVGGIYGYCQYLCEINGEPAERFEDVNEALEWGKEMGWTGRMKKPESIL